MQSGFMLNKQTIGENHISFWIQFKWDLEQTTYNLVAAFTPQTIHFNYNPIARQAARTAFCGHSSFYIVGFCYKTTQI